MPSISISKDLENNNIKIDSISNDIGTKYEYYVEAYDSVNLSLIVKSNLHNV